MDSLREVSLALALALRQLTDRRLLGMLLLALAIATMAPGPVLLMFALLFGFLDLILPDSLTLPLLGRVDFPGMFSDGIFSGTAWLFWTYLISPLAVAIIGALLDPRSRRGGPPLPEPAAGTAPWPVSDGWIRHSLSVSDAWHQSRRMDRRMVDASSRQRRFRIGQRLSDLPRILRDGRGPAGL